VDFVDGVLVRLADPGSRAGLFDGPSMANLVETAYDTDAMPVSPPFSPVFDDLRLGYAALPLSRLEGEWADPTGMHRMELRLRLAGFGNQPLRVDALWRGALVVRTVPALDHIEALEFDLPSFDVDPEIIADLGSLPADSQQLEAERRKRLLAHLRAGLDQPAAFTDDHLDRLLAGAGARGVGDLVEHFRGQVQASSVQLRYSPPSGAQPTAMRLAFAAAVLVRDQGFSLAELLADSQLVRLQTEDLGLEVPAEPTVRQRQRIVVVVIVPGAVFDDSAWPGGDTGSADQKRAARFQRAGQWLAREGIGLVAVN
jgi:hypothetical protein